MTSTLKAPTPEGILATITSPDGPQRTEAVRRLLLADVRDTVLELGPGSGVNLPLYRSDVHWIATFVLCSVDHVPTALSEIRRVLRPGGRYMFCEHVAAPPGTSTRRGQDAWARVITRGRGCRPNR